MPRARPKADFMSTIVTCRSVALVAWLQRLDVSSKLTSQHVPFAHGIELELKYRLGHAGDPNDASTDSA